MPLDFVSQVMAAASAEAVPTTVRPSSGRTSSFQLGLAGSVRGSLDADARAPTK